MRLPKPSLSEYASNTAVVVGTVAVLQYVGVVSDGSGTVDIGFLAALAASFLAFTYLFDVATENAEWGSSSDAAAGSDGGD